MSQHLNAIRLLKLNPGGGHGCQGLEGEAHAQGEAGREDPKASTLVPPTKRGKKWRENVRTWARVQPLRVTWVGGLGMAGGSGLHTPLDSGLARAGCARKAACSTAA